MPRWGEDKWIVQIRDGYWLAPWRNKHGKGCGHTFVRSWACRFALKRTGQDELAIARKRIKYKDAQIELYKVNAGDD